MDRKSLLIQEDLGRPKVPKDPKTLENEASEGMALRMMIESRGWKVLLEKFINPRNSLQRFLQTKTIQERHEVHGALSELSALMSFINRHINDGKDSFEELETIKKNNGRK